MRTTSGIYRFSTLVQSFLFITFLAISSSAQILQIDSVSVDSVWNSDSSWNDDQNVLQNRVSRDCKIGFFPKGTGKVQCIASITLDSGKTWTEVTKLSDQLFSCGSKSNMIVRVLGGDKPGAAFRVTGRQYKPLIRGNPKIIRYSNVPDKDPVPGSVATIPVKLLLANDTSSSGYAAITKVYWDTLGDGSWDDSTTSLSWTWNTKVPLDTLIKSKKIVAKVRDGNGFWSVPETLTVQFGLKNLLYFEGFEGRNLDSAGFQKIYNPAAYGWMSVSTKAAHSGSSALASDSNNTGLRKWLDDPIKDSIAGLEFYLMAKSAGHTNIFAAIVTMGTSAGMLNNGFSTLLGMGISKSDSLWYAFEKWNNPLADSDLVHTNFAALEFNKWYKCTIEYNFSTKSVTYYLDNTAVFTRSAPGFRVLDMFITYRDALGEQGPKDYFIDDVTIYKR
jgi:hypothetical protein